MWLEVGGTGAQQSAQRHEQGTTGEKFAWRGTAASREAALRAACVAWEERFGSPPEGCRAQVLEIEPGHAGFADG